MDTDSYVEDCFVEAREGENISLAPLRIRGYAIVPKEKYEKLVADYSPKNESSLDQV